MKKVLMNADGRSGLGAQKPLSQKPGVSFISVERRTLGFFADE